LAAEHASALDALRAATSQEIAELVREHGAALEVARANERASATASTEALMEQRISEATTRIRGEAEMADADRQATRDAEMREWTAQRDLEHQTLVTRIADLEKRVADGREALDEERRDRLREEFETTRSSEELEARVKSSNEQNTALERALADVRDEVPALEGEISALRAELTALRASMESESTLLRVANAQLERNKRLLDRAKEALVELVEDGDKIAVE
jgi:chromosome segregation ATPase